MTASLALGTAQLGLDYGIANERGMPSEEDALALIHHALDCGITMIDTAAAYGLSEERIGKALASGQGDIASLTISTKLEPNASDEASALASIEHSRKQLQSQKLNVLMMHRFEQYTNPDIWRHCLSAKENGLVKTLGISVQSRMEAERAVDDPDVGFMQLPCNLLDWRWHGFRCERDDLHIQLRSVLLQGLLCMEAKHWPRNISPEKALHITGFLQQLANEHSGGSIVALAYRYVQALPWVDSVVVGMESMSQLDENKALFSKPPLPDAICEHIEKAVADIPESLLNPALWERA